MTPYELIDGNLLDGMAGSSYLQLTVGYLF